MTGFLERIRSHLALRIPSQSRLRKEGCVVKTTNLPKLRLIIDFDKPGLPLAGNELRCDYLVIAEDQRGIGWVAPLELKRGQLHAHRVFKQLQAGARAAEQLVGLDEAVKFRPVAASGRVSKHERTMLKKRQCMVSFHGRREPIRLISCGDPLSRALGT